MPSHNLKCPDCGHPVGWSVNEGECPRNMQNYQSDECKARQIAWLKAKLDAALQVVAVADEEFALVRPRAYQEARSILGGVLANPA